MTVALIHTDSGPGWNVYVCRECAPYYPAGRDADRQEGPQADRRRR